MSKKFTRVLLNILMIGMSSCSIWEERNIPQSEIFDVFEFIEGKISYEDGLKISNTNVVYFSGDKYRDFVEKIDETTLIYKDNNNDFFIMEVNLYAKHGESLFTSVGGDVSKGFFIIDEFLEVIEGQISLDDEVILNGDIINNRSISCLKYFKNINSTTALYTSPLFGGYEKYTINLNENDREGLFLFKKSDFYNSIDDAKNDENEDKWSNSFKLQE